MINLGDKFKKSGQIWVVTSVAAGIITLSSGNGKRPDMILYPSEILRDFKQVGR
jgi:hypothetical protein